MPAESTMHPDGPPGRCAPAEPTPSESTPGRWEGRASAQQSTRTSEPCSQNSKAKGREAGVDLEECVGRARLKSMLSHSP